MSRERKGKLPLSRCLGHRWRAAATVMATTALLAVGTASAAGPTAHDARTCSPPKYPGLGYFTSLSVSRVGCATGGKLIVAYYHCRTRSGPSGHCHGTVLGYTCSERRNSIPTEIDGRVTCHRRSATVIHTYQQDI